ncbi:MAG: hypothetical protein L6R37_002668 [Teloschistes peruensis]|nr:MAG: hypothetical protein L6R37_002668 [Teloschistes peruensis]
MLDWCISELQDYAADFAKTKIIPALDRSILKSDHLLTSAIRDDLSKAVAQLEQDPSNTIPMSADPDGVSRTPSRFYKTRIGVQCPDYGDIPNLEPGEYQILEARTQWQYLRNKSRERPSVNLRKHFADLGLQFIVEASSINLDPLLQYWDPHAWDWDRDANGSWCNNERICATVLYFYDCDDLHQGLLDFEQRVSNDEAMEVNSLCETRETEELVEDFPLSLYDANVMKKELLAAERAEFAREREEAMYRECYNLMSEARRDEEEMGYH